MQRLILTILFLTNILVSVNAQDFKKSISSYVETFSRSDMHIGKPKLQEIIVDDSLQAIRVRCNDTFGEQYFTEESVERVYRDVKRMIPDSLRHYTLTVETDNHPIEELVPNAIRTKNKTSELTWGKIEYKGAPWVKNLSRPFSITHGLEGVHLAVCQSHGIFYDQKKKTWRWQRPRLFCTTEDLFTQTIVLPYIIPMLENAGAIVYTARERNWQRNEVIVDNDAPNANGSAYIEQKASYMPTSIWGDCDKPGFAKTKSVYYPGDNPFHHGTARVTVTTTDKEHASAIEWIPNIPEDGAYAVYVSYQTQPKSIDNAHYTVYHKGGKTEFSVNQQMGGSTWVYLGTFDFEKGSSNSGMVTLDNYSHQSGVVTADAVRFGGGMGNISMGGSKSGLPRWAEAARYSAQWAGMRDTTYDCYNGEDDYKSDIQSRPRVANELSGGSVYAPTIDGRRVPIELNLAFHSDAGFSRTDELIGSLSICSTNFYDGKTNAGITRYVSRDLASLFLLNLRKDLRQYKWEVRKLFNRNYGETRVPQMPGALLEMLSHQNFADMRLGFNPQFKFDFARSAYKTIVKYIAATHNRDYTIQPLPVRNFAVTIDEKESRASLSWEPTNDELEPTAHPTHYILYVRRDNGSYDNGTIINGSSCTIKLNKDRLYSFRVCAYNKGGISFPSETLTAYIDSKSKGKILIVNSFTRLSGPASYNTSTEQGFLLGEDPGIPYGAFAGFCGEQKVFTKSTMGSEATTGLGYSGTELEGKIIMGNTFDYPVLHGQGIMPTHYSFCSCSEEAFVYANADASTSAHKPLHMSNYKMIDVIYGVQKEFSSKTKNLLRQYVELGGRILVSGANIVSGNAVPAELFKTTLDGRIKNQNINALQGCGTHFSIYRSMNPESYAVPQTEALTAQAPAFAMLAYSTGQTAGVAYEGNDYKSIILGFPIESIKETSVRNQLITAFVTFLCK